MKFFLQGVKMNRCEHCGGEMVYYAPSPTINQFEEERCLKCGRIKYPEGFHVYRTKNDNDRGKCRAREYRGRNPIGDLHQEELEDMGTLNLAERYGVTSAAASFVATKKRKEYDHKR